MTSESKVNDCECKKEWYHLNKDTNKTDSRCGCATTSDYKNGEVMWCKCENKEGKWKNCSTQEIIDTIYSDNCECDNRGCGKTSNHENGTVPWCYTKGCCDQKYWKNCQLEYDLEEEVKQAEAAANQAEAAANQAEAAVNQAEAVSDQADVSVNLDIVNTDENEIVKAIEDADKLVEQADNDFNKAKEEERQAELEFNNYKSQLLNSNSN